MKKILLILLLFLILPSCSQPQPIREKPEQKSTISLDQFEGTARIYCCMVRDGHEYIFAGGSGFFVTYRGSKFLVTAKHVIESPAIPYDVIKVVLTDNRIVTLAPANFKDSDYGYDVSVARMDEVTNYKTFNMTDKTTEDADRIGKYIVMGYMGAEAPTLYHGKGYGYIYHDRKSYIVTNHRIAKGVSGSPLLDENDEVIGVASLYISGVSNRGSFVGSFYVPIRYAKDAIEKY